ncbi:anterior gradient protein 2 homolog [Anoplopoma fimbria]|uniref:anterior gradient protein 2 homolog n=1 Tax=Anoplopoma fimbria TaxID=229290 RepID=UPI0023EB8DB1|nr:anterior gradient protein 2 homolog [Anoplopoma fimbria]
MLRWVLFALILGICACAGKPQKKKETPKSLARGWGDSIKWVESYEKGLSEMVKRKKPLMVIHHLDHCPHSQALKKAFAADKAIQKMAEKDFIMLNLLEETKDEDMGPDGRYVPRILFVDPSKTVRTELIGKFNSHLYTYEPADMKLCE